jgi:hypothetical protein
MKKEFNVTGICRPAKHYMADVSTKLANALNLVERGKYFAINRPRQYGKTTTLHTITALLEKTGEYLVFRISFEGIGDEPFKAENAFVRVFLELLAQRIKSSEPDIAAFINAKSAEVQNLKELSAVITGIADHSSKALVLIIDEVDSSSNNELFIRFLAMLRDKYLDQDNEKTFHSVILAGFYDVKSLKLKLRPDAEQKYSSPWNIAADFKVNMNLLPHEIKPMLDDYVQERGVTMDTQAIANELFYYTSGYPYLTSHLCKLIDEEILPEKTTQEWTKDDVFRAFQMIMKIPNNTNFDSLFKHLREFPALHELVYALVIEGQTLNYSSYSETTNLGILHGILAEDQFGKLKIHNRIYRELIADVMVTDWRSNNLASPDKIENGFEMWNKFRLPNNGLDMIALTEGFQAFMRENYSEKDRKLLERDGRLIFLAYLKPIINGSGFDFKEPQISEERRLDLVITFFQHRYLAELKVWRGEAAHQEGLNQLADYLDRLGLDTGYLVIFDNNKEKTWAKDWAEVKGKRIFWVKV